MKKLLIALLLSGSCFGVIAKTLTFGTEASYAPFEFYNDNNQMIGFDIDIAKRICEISQITCTFKNQSFDSLIPSLKTRRIDAAIAGIDITAKRREQVLFTDPYYQNSGEFFANKTGFATIDDLKNKRIGVQNGTTHQRYLMDNYPNMQLVPYDSYQYAVLDLKSHRIDAIFSDKAVGDRWIASDNTLSAIGTPVTDPDYFGEGLAIAIRKGNPELIYTFNKAIKEMKEDGSYQKIYRKWFGTK